MKKDIIRRAVSAFALLFGLVTIKAGGSVLFVESAREAAGDYVAFVLWFNFLAGFLYVLASLGIFRQQKWGAQLSAVIAGMTVLVFIAFGFRILTGGLYEVRTVAAMSLRSLVWLAIALWQRPMLRGT